MPGSTLLGLNRGGMGLDGRADVVGPVTYHDHDAFGLERAHGRQQVLDHRSAGDGVQDLWQVRLHARAQACGEDNGGNGGVGRCSLGHNRSVG